MVISLLHAAVLKVSGGIISGSQRAGGGVDWRLIGWEISPTGKKWQECPSSGATKSVLRQ